MKRIAAVTRKEVQDSLRDRRTLVVMLITAVAAGPVLLMLLLYMAGNQADRARTLRLPVVGPERAPAVVAYLQRQQVEILPAPDDYEARIRAGEVDIVMVVD